MDGNNSRQHRHSASARTWRRSHAAEAQARRLIAQYEPMPPNVARAMILAALRAWLDWFEPKGVPHKSDRKRATTRRRP